MKTSPISCKEGSDRAFVCFWYCTSAVRLGLWIGCQDQDNIKFLWGWLGMITMLYHSASILFIYFWSSWANDGDSSMSGVTDRVSDVPGFSA